MTASGCRSESAYRYSWTPTADRGRSSSTASPNALGRGIQQAVALPPRPTAGAASLALLVGDDAWHAGIIRLGPSDGAGATLQGEHRFENTLHAFRVARGRGAAAHRSLARRRRAARPSRGGRRAGPRRRWRGPATHGCALRPPRRAARRRLSPNANFGEVREERKGDSACTGAHRVSILYTALTIR